MAQAEEKLFDNLRGKLLLWLAAYLDRTNRDTFLNSTASAKEADYKCKDENSFQSMGSQNLSKLKPRIDKWLTDAALTEDALRKKLVDLVNAEETKIINIKGKITKANLPDNCKILVESEQTKLAGKDAIEYVEEHTVMAVNMDSLPIQQKSLDMAFKVKGMYQSDKMNDEDVDKLANRILEARKRLNGDRKDGG